MLFACSSKNYTDIYLIWKICKKNVKIMILVNQEIEKLDANKIKLL